MDRVVKERLAWPFSCSYGLSDVRLFRCDLICLSCLFLSLSFSFPSQTYMLQDSLDHAQLFNLMRQMLEFDPAQRITFAEALLHPFFTGLSPEERRLNCRDSSRDLSRWQMSGSGDSCRICTYSWDWPDLYCGDSSDPSVAQCSKVLVQCQMDPGHGREGDSSPKAQICLIYLYVVKLK